MLPSQDHGSKMKSSDDIVKFQFPEYKEEQPGYLETYDAFAIHPTLLEEANFSLTMTAWLQRELSSQ